LGSEAAEQEWAQRFSPMRLKRLGPSVVPAEVIVPLAELPAMLSDIGTAITQPFVLEGMCLKGDQVVLLGFIPHDQRTLAYNAAFALALTVTNLAKRHGGSAYSTGLFFRSEASAILGEEKVETLQRFKRDHDPRDLMNPDKVIGSGMLRAAMDVAGKFEPFLRPIANAATAKPGNAEGASDVHGLPGDVAFYSYACAQCGYCVPTCEEFSVRGWESHSPRGKYRYLREVAEGREKIDQRMVDAFLVCTTCEVCNTRCQLQLPVEHSWMKMRGRLINDEKRMTFPPFEMMAASLRGERDIWAGKAEHRADWVPVDMKAKLKAEGPLMYFAGCTASYVNTDVAEATVRLLTDAGYDVAYMGKDESCCGIPMKCAGKWDLFEEIYARNTNEARRRGAKTIVTSCPACSLVWKEMYAAVAKERGEAYEFEVKHYSELISEALKDGRLVLDKKVKARVTFHDSCHIGRAQGIYEPPRDLLRAMPGVELVEMEHNRANGMCCGSVLTLVGEKPLAPLLGGKRLREATAVGAEKLVALCPCCEVQLRDSAKKNHIDMPVTDLARFVAEAKGYQIPDKTDRSLYMWGFFDKFIDLMKPAEMAKVMSDVFPQMMEAMPLGMKPMLRGMKRIPGGLWLVSKLLPMLFPLLANGVLQEIMPDLVGAVRRRVGTMPDDMEALVPDLLPQTMKSLMPNYLPLLIPFVTPLFVEHLRTT
jgi:Fe-S oxidoreductase